jgi:ferredoxin like protein
MSTLSIPDLLSANKYELDEVSHIRLDQRLYKESLTAESLLYVCPAQVYTKQGEEIIADHAGCLECGTCLVACSDGFLTWNYPRGSFGIIYRYA